MMCSSSKSGHMPMFEEQAVFVQAVTNFLQTFYLKRKNSVYKGWWGRAVLATVLTYYNKGVPR